MKMPSELPAASTIASIKSQDHHLAEQSVAVTFGGLLNCQKATFVHTSILSD
jgi:hypothetical protein